MADVDVGRGGRIEMFEQLLLRADLVTDCDRDCSHVLRPRSLLCRWHWCSGADIAGVDPNVVQHQRVGSFAVEHLRQDGSSDALRFSVGVVEHGIQRCDHCRDPRRVFDL
jgi:hypothetical protein